jgi:hypothetical protein
MQILPNAAVLLHCRPAEVYAPVTNYLSGCIVVLQCCIDLTL